MSKIIVEVCAGIYCTMMGSMDIMDAIASLSELRHDLNPDREIEVRAIPCPGTCDQGQLAPLVFVNGQPIYRADSETVMAMILEQA